VHSVGNKAATWERKSIKGERGCACGLNPTFRSFEGVNFEFPG